MKIRTLVQATPTGKVGDVFDNVEVDPASGSAWVPTDFGGFRLSAQEFEVVPDTPGTMACTTCRADKSVNEFATPDECTSCFDGKRGAT